MNKDRFPDSTRRRTLVPALSLTLLLAGCTSAGQTAETTSAAPSSIVTTDCGPLQSFNLIGAAHDARGGHNAVNTGECAGIYTRENSATVGEIAANASFVIVCKVDKPLSLDIQAEGITNTAAVNLVGAAANALNSDELPIPDCQ